MQTICAFANDFDNVGGGYIVVGQECTNDGVPVFPPTGLALNQLDRIQIELHSVLPNGPTDILSCPECRRGSRGET